MLKVTKDFSFDCAHMLYDHPGQCRNLHGHTYKLQVSAALHPNVRPDREMVVDFSDLKALVKDLIVDQFDHAFVYNNQTESVTEQCIFDSLEDAGLKTVSFNGRATAESMAANFHFLLNEHLASAKAGYFISDVYVWETPTSCAHFGGNF